MANLDDTRHISNDQYEDIKCQLDDLINMSKINDNTEELVYVAISTILDILCLELPV